MGSNPGGTVEGMTIPGRKTARLRWEPINGAFIPVVTPEGGDGATTAAWARNLSQVPPEAATRTVRVFKGERALVADNFAFGEVELTTGADGTVVVLFDINANGELSVNGTNLGNTAQTAMVTFGRHRRRQMERSRSWGGTPSNKSRT